MSDAVTTTATPRSDRKRPRLRTALLAGGGLFGLLLLIGVVPRVLSRIELGKAANIVTSAVPRVPTAKPHLAEPMELELPATALAFQQTTIYGRVSGYLQRRLVDIGDRVKTGQLLAVIDAPDLDQQVAQARGVLAQARASLVQQQANLDYARVSLRRYEEANHDGAVAQLDLDTRRTAVSTSAALVQALDKSAAEARAAFEGTSDEHLKTNWQLKARGVVVQEAPRFEMIQDTINHWAHHRGQMTVYLRLMGAKVPAIYGPSADERSFR